MSIKRTIIAAIVGLTLVAMVAPGVAQGVTIDELLAQIAQLQSQLLALQGNTGGTPVPTGNVACSGVTFTRALVVGSEGTDVKCLQVLLNNNGYTLAQSGAGSPGMETSYFGPITLAAVKQFQAAKGWTPANQVGPLTRAALNALITTTGGNTGGNTGGTTGSVTAMLAYDNPPAGALVGSQAQADMLHINFTGSGTVTSVTLTRDGFSDQNLFTNVYLYDGNTRLTDGYSFNVNSTLTMNGLSIPVNGSHVISVRGDVMASASATQGSAAIALTGFTANGATASANVRGNMMSVVSGTLAAAYMTTNTYDGQEPTVNAGTSQYSLWSDSIQVNTRTIQLKGMNFKMIGSAPTNALANIRLFVDGVDSGTVATVGSIQGSNYAMFNLATPINLSTGTHTIDVRADIVTGASRTIQLSVQQAADMTLYDPQVGVNLAVQSASDTAFVADNGATVSINAGSSTIVVDPTFGSQTDVTAGATNAVIGKFLIHGYGEDVKVNTLYVTPQITDATAGTCSTDGSGVATNTCGLNNVTLYFNGSQVGTQQNDTSANMSAGTAMTFNLGSQMIIPAGQDSTLEVRADLQTTGGVNYTAGTVTTTLVGSSSSNNAQGQSSSTIIDVPGADVATTGLSISSASLVVSKNTSIANYSAAPNTSNVKIGSFVAQNQSTSEAVRLTTLTVALDSDTSGTDLTTSQLTGLSGLRTSDTTGAGSNPIQPSASNVFSVNDVLQPGQQMTIDIYANVGSSSLISAVVTTLKVASIGVSSNIVDAGTAKTGQLVTFSTGTLGTPAIVTSSTTPAQYIAAGGGATNATQATFNFVSTSGASTITELKFTVSDADSDPAATVTNICVEGICAQPVSSVADLKGLNLAVPNGGGGLTQDVLVSYAPVGTSGVTPGDTTYIHLTYVKSVSGGVTTTDSSVDVAAPTVTLVGSKPTVTVPNSSSTGLNIGSVENKIGEITVTADAKGAIKLNDIQFSVGTSNLSALTLTAARIADGSTTITGSSCGQGDATNTSQTVFCEFGTGTKTTTTGTGNVESNTDYDGYLLAAGQSKTFSLYATVNGTLSGTNAASLSTSLVAAGFNWDDTSTNGASGTNLTGSLIYGFPTNSYTRVQ